MKLERFKQLHEKYKKLPMGKEIWDTPEYEEYSNAIHNDSACGNYYFEIQLIEANFPYKNQCCLTMAHKLAFPGNDRDVDQIMMHYEDGDYGIPVHDGGSSYIKIDYCPWCGKKL